MENLSKEITETVTKLADLIKSDPRYGAVMEAQKAYTEDAQISRLLTEYNVQQAALAEAFQGRTGCAAGGIHPQTVGRALSSGGGEPSIFGV